MTPSVKSSESKSYCSLFSLCSVLSNGAQSQGPRLLYSFGSCLVVITHYCFERAKRLPYPFGPTIKQVDGTMNTWLHPFIGTLEQQSLCLLSFADDQIYALGSAVENYAPATSATLYKIRDLQGKFEEALSLVHYSLDRKGFIGVSTDLWIRYEEALKERAQRAVNVANRIPLLNLITPLFCAITVPFAEKISDWLVKHSEVKVKSIQAEGEVQREVHEIAAHDLQSTSEIVTEEFLQKDTALSKAEFDEEFEGKSTAEEAVETFYFGKEDTTMPDVLVEMIDSGWLLGSSASFIKRNPTLATRSSMSRSSSSRSEGPSCL